MYIVIRRVYRLSVPRSRHVGWYPLGNLVLDWILLRAIWMCLTGRVNWRGTEYGPAAKDRARRTIGSDPSRVMKPMMSVGLTVGARRRRCATMSWSRATPRPGPRSGRVPATPPGAARRDRRARRRRRRGWSRRGWRGRRQVARPVVADPQPRRRRWADRSARRSASRGSRRWAATSSRRSTRSDGRSSTAGSALADQRIGPAWQRWLLMPPGRVPVGTVRRGRDARHLELPAVPQRAADRPGLAAGNAVVWKASELAPLCGREAGAEPGGGRASRGTGHGRLRRAGGRPGAGGVATWTRGCSPAGSTTAVTCWRRWAPGIPAVAELSGFDPAIVLPDAPLESTVRGLTWAAFVGCGQTCVAVKRVYVVGDPAPWAEALAAAARALRVGDPAARAIDVGPMISPTGRERFHRTVQRGRAGGRRPGRGRAARRGVVLSADRPPGRLAEPEDVLAGAFGPVVVVRGVAREADAVDAANRSRSPWPPASGAERPRRAGSASAPGGDGHHQRRGHAHRARLGPLRRRQGQRLSAAPRAPLGLREFAQPQVLFSRRPADSGRSSSPIPRPPPRTILLGLPLVLPRRAVSAASRDRRRKDPRSMP